jgi:hypothetical protein
MKAGAILAVVALTATVVVFAKPSAKPRVAHPDDATFKVEQLAYMTGSWDTTRGNSHLEEHWMAPAGGCMMGMMRQTTDGKTGIREYEIIEETPEGILMTFKHVGPKMVDIAGRSLTRKLVSIKNDEAIFESLGPEPKQKIVYKKEADGSMNVLVEIDQNGKLRKIELPMKRMAAK